MSLLTHYHYHQHAVTEGRIYGGTYFFLYSTTTTYISQPTTRERPESSRIVPSTPRVSPSTSTTNQIIAGILTNYIPCTNHAISHPSQTRITDNKWPLTVYTTSQYLYTTTTTPKKRNQRRKYLVLSSAQKTNQLFLPPTHREPSVLTSYIAHGLSAGISPVQIG